MKTKIVYVVVGNKNNVFVEQVWVSAWSLKHFNSDSSITLVADQETYDYIIGSSLKDSLDLFDDCIIKGFDVGVCGVERSRWLKTKLRELVSGDFLYLDTDTIITGDLSFVDDFSFDIGFVLDLHCSLYKHPWESILRSKIRNLYNIEIPSKIDFHNGGVFYAKDTDLSHRFFDLWHSNWEKTIKINGKYLDQPPLVLTDIEMGGVIHSMDGRLNCQISGSIEYLHTGRLLHFFNMTWSKTNLSPFFGTDFYMGIRESHGLTESMKDLILNCKSQFTSPSMPIQIEDMKLWNSSQFLLLRSLYKHKRLWGFFESIAIIINKHFK